MANNKALNIFEDLRGPTVSDGQPFSVVPTAATEQNALARISSSLIPIPEETMRIATRLRMALTESDRSIAFTGPAASDLASELAQNIAIALSQFAPDQVLLIDAGGARPDGQKPGLSDVLLGKCALQNALIEPTDGGPWLLSGGSMVADRSHLYFTAECAMLFTALKQKFTHVLVDAGPLASPASLVMIGRCDTVAVALAAGPHHKTEVLQLQKELARVKTRMLGLVLTKKIGAGRRS